MGNNNTINKTLQRQRCLVKIIQQRLKKAHSDSIIFDIKDFGPYPLLKDFDDLVRAFRRIQTELAPNFEHQIIKRPISSSVADIDNKTPSFVITGIKVIVDDRSKLNDYLRTPVKKPALEFDPNKSCLHVRGKEITIRKFTDQYHTLRIIFEDPKEIAKNWFFSEIAEKVDVRKPTEKTYYNATHQVRLKLEAKGFPNFFKTTTQSVQINAEYLS